MRTCPHCNHAFSETAATPAQCPACGKPFTISDIGAQTLDLGTATVADPLVPPKLDATIESSLFGPPLPSGKSPATPAAPPEATYQDLGATTDSSLFTTPPAGDKPATYQDLGGTTDSSLFLPGDPPAAVSPKDKTYHALGQTIQAGKFVPSAEEMAEGLSSANTGTVELRSQVGMMPADVRDLTHMWDSSIASSQPGTPAQPTLRSSQVSGIVSGGQPSGLGSSQSIGAESLEQSLVIQPRVLRPDSSVADTATHRIDYNLLKKLGEGGMGIVYAARQSSIRRTVALKMLKPAGAQQAAHREKFLAEAVITGDLEHPNIVPIYDLGRDEAGAIFYAM
ncbi:MAG: protein kinase, partial [Pirellulaceae bacterium]|nr:protein kinase [Pirellulaceae bacterium]